MPSGLFQREKRATVIVVSRLRIYAKFRDARARRLRRTQYHLPRLISTADSLQSTHVSKPIITVVVWTLGRWTVGTVEQRAYQSQIHPPRRVSGGRGKGD